jgi:hypothetical protein
MESPTNSMRRVGAAGLSADNVQRLHTDGRRAAVVGFVALAHLDGVVAGGQILRQRVRAVFRNADGGGRLKRTIHVHMQIAEIDRRGAGGVDGDGRPRAVHVEGETAVRPIEKQRVVFHIRATVQRQLGQLIFRHIGGGRDAADADHAQQQRQRQQQCQPFSCFHECISPFSICSYCIMNRERGQVLCMISSKSLCLLLSARWQRLF